MWRTTGSESGGERGCRGATKGPRQPSGSCCRPGGVGRQEAAAPRRAAPSLRRPPALPCVHPPPAPCLRRARSQQAVPRHSRHPPSPRFPHAHAPTPAPIGHPPPLPSLPRHMISTFEQAIRLMPQAAPQPGSRPVESWCWVLDFHGFSVRDCDPRLAKARPGSQGLTAAAGQKLAAETAPHPPPAAPRKLPPPRPAACLQIFLNLSAAHYPERLGTFFVVSAPSVFNTLWRAISHFIDPVTKQKVRLCWPPLMAPVSLQACSSAAASPPALWAPPRPPTSDPFPPSLPPPHPPPPPPPTDPFRELQPQGQQQAGGAARCAPLQHPQLRVESTPIS